MGGVFDGRATESAKSVSGRLINVFPDNLETGGVVYSRLCPLRRRRRTIETLLWWWKNHGLKARLGDCGLFGSCSWSWRCLSQASFSGRLSSLAVLRVGGTRLAASCTELASWSAISFPSIPTWLGIQMIETLMPDVMMTFASRLIVVMDGWEKGRWNPEIACTADRESEQMTNSSGGLGRLRKNSST